MKLKDFILKKINFYLLALIFLVLSLSGTQAFALNKAGHKLVCQLAYEQVSIHTQQEIDKLINNLSSDQTLSVNTYNHLKKNNKVSFAQSCTWADAIKYNKHFKKYKSWHYMNVSRDNNSVTPQDCKHNCISQAILTHQKRLKNKRTPSHKRAEALMFLGHWLGDIHQPFHVSFASDLGGNKNKTHLTSINKLAQKCNNLHWIWDDCLLILPADSNTKDTYQRTYATLKVLLQSLPWQQLKQWQSSNVWEIANESFNIVKQEQVLYCRIAQGICQQNILHEKALPTTYQRQHIPILHQRLLQASIRLAYRLEHALKKR